MSPLKSIGLYFVVSALLVGQVFSKPDGAPTAACEDTTPQHSGLPQSSTCPFVIKTSKVSPNQLTLIVDYIIDLILC